MSDSTRIIDTNTRQQDKHTVSRCTAQAEGAKRTLEGTRLRQAGREQHIDEQADAPLQAEDAAKMTQLKADSARPASAGGRPGQTPAGLSETKVQLTHQAAQCSAPDAAPARCSTPAAAGSAAHPRS